MNVFRKTLLAAIALTTSLSFAVKMDETTHDEVIRRLELGLDGMDKNEPERNGIVLRLADLYADRARLKAMNEIEKNCKDCKGALGDRKKALSLYEDGLGKAEKSEQGRIVLQIAHLYVLNEQPSKATDLYNKIIRNGKQYTSETRGVAHQSLGEIYFKKNDFKNAKKEYGLALHENLKNRAMVEYRIAWCELNLGNNAKAISILIGMLRNPKAMSSDGQVDQTFVADVSNDLATFMAHAEVSQKQINLLRSLSPDNARKNNLHTLATETDRLGKKNSALIVWAAYVEEGDVKAEEKLEVELSIAQIYYDMNKQDKAAQSFEKTMGFWRKGGCSDQSSCDDLKTHVRKFVTAWNKGQKDKPTENLFRVYWAYTQTFPSDVEMLSWAGQVARDMKKHKEAAQIFHQASVQAGLDLKKKPDDQGLKKLFEGSLLAEIEMAEASKDNKARLAAYEYYLAVNPNGSQNFEVRYQRAQMYYAANRYQDAFGEFHYLATQPGNDHHDLKVKSADLALDCLVAMKDDKALQVRSLEYARAFPERKNEYMKISRKATMTLVANGLKNEKNADKSDYKESLTALAAVNLDGADDQEKIKFLKDKISIAEKAMDLGAVKSAAAKLLTVKSLKADDREWTMAQQVWAAELELDFATAYRISQNMKLEDSSKADRELRLAMLAELAGKSPRKHNEAYLEFAKNIRQANLVRVTLIKNSVRPWTELDKQMRYMKQTPDLLAGLTLEIFAQHKDFNRAEHVLDTTSIGKYPAGETLRRHLDLRTFFAFDQKIRTHRIHGFNDAVTGRTLKERMNLIAQSDKNTQIAFRRHDWTLEILNLAQLARENRRVYHDILALPIPRRLSAADKVKYQALIKAQSDPYLNRAEKLDQQLNSMWSQPASMQNLQTAYMTASPEMQKLYRDEILPLAQNAPQDAANRLHELLNTPFRRPSQRDIMTARRDLQQDPFDISKAEHLRELESQNGKPEMVVYLDERISQLKKAKTL